MKTSDLRRHRAALEAKRDELSEAIWGRDDILVERVSDDMDNLQLATERELAISHLCLEAGLLRAVKTALARIDDGSYGICLSCDDEISQRRLQVIPWAAHCVTCQDELDQGHGAGPARVRSVELGTAA